MWINGTWRKQFQNKLCKVCNIKIITTDPRKQYCSTKCKQKLNQSGKQYHLKYKFGITQTEFIKMILDQDNKCLICKTEFSDSIKPCVDHNHETEEIRGILCFKCNTGIGLFTENINVLFSAIDYLNNSSNRSYRRTRSSAIAS